MKPDQQDNIIAKIEARCRIALAEYHKPCSCHDTRLA